MATLLTFPLLFINDFALDTKAEQEILATGDMPLTVDIVFADSARQPVRETSITELHWFYNKDRKDTAMVAVESNIESTGQTFEIAKIAFIRVSGIAYTVNAKTPVNPS